MEEIGEFNPNNKEMEKKLTKDNLNIKIFKNKDGKTFCNVFVRLKGKIAKIGTDKIKNLKPIVETIGITIKDQTIKTYDIECDINNYNNIIKKKKETTKPIKKSKKRKGTVKKNPKEGITKKTSNALNKYKKSKDYKIIKELCEKMKTFENPTMSYRVVLSSVFKEIFSLEMNLPGSFIDNKSKKMENLKTIYPHMFEVEK